MMFVTAACGGGGGAVSINEAADLYASGTETMTIKGALVFEHGKPMLCSGVAPDAGPGLLCESPAFYLDFAEGLSPAIAGMELKGDGNGQWVEDVSFHGTLDEGVFTVDE